MARRKSSSLCFVQMWRESAAFSQVHRQCLNCHSDLQKARWYRERCEALNNIGRSFMKYDEGNELTRYVWNHCVQFMTDLELRAGRAISGREQAAFAKSPVHAELIRQKYGEMNDADINAALSDGAEAFRLRVRNRILSEHETGAFVHRCPSCKRVLRTPKAQQCFWCGLDWH